MNVPFIYVLTRTGGELVCFELKDEISCLDLDARGCLDAPNFLATGGVYNSIDHTFPCAILREGA